MLGGGGVGLLSGLREGIGSQPYKVWYSGIGGLGESCCSGFLHRYQVTCGDVTWAYVLMAGQSRVRKGLGGLEDGGPVVISIVSPAFPELSTQY